MHTALTTGRLQASQLGVCHYFAALYVYVCVCACAMQVAPMQRAILIRTSVVATSVSASTPTMGVAKK